MKQMTRSALLKFALSAALAMAVSNVYAAAQPKDAASKDAAPTSSNDDGTPIGMNIFGDKESPIGLYITPWKNAYAEKGLDRPARLLDEAVQPIDPGTFRRQMEYYQTISDYRRAQLKAEGPR